jgi:hypothetical protein
MCPQPRQHSVAVVNATASGRMKAYVVLRRGGWGSGDDLSEAVERSTAMTEAMQDDVRLICSYVLTETDGSIGTVCVYEATGPEAIRAHTRRAGMPVDEIVGLAGTLPTDREALAAPTGAKEE